MSSLENGAMFLAILHLTKGATLAKLIGASGVPSETTTSYIRRRKLAIKLSC